MPSEMFERGRRDAEADALDENYYQYYYDYKLAYDEVLRNRRRTRRQVLLRQTGRWLLWALPVVLLAAGIAGYARYNSAARRAALAAALTPTATPTERPTLVPPTPEPPATPTVEPVLQAGGFAIVSGTSGAPLRARAGPGTNRAVVARFQEGQTVKVIEGPQDATGMAWWRVELDGTSGWASATYLKPVAPPP